jgi:hypothetical protein
MYKLENCDSDGVQHTEQAYDFSTRYQTTDAPIWSQMCDNSNKWVQGKQITVLFIVGIMHVIVYMLVCVIST